MYGKYENINYMIVTPAGPSQQLLSQSLPGDLAVAEGQRNGKLGHSC